MSVAAGAPPRFDLVVFDWDGTLYDSTTLIADCIRSACADMGLPDPGAQRASYVIGLGLRDALARVAPGLTAAGEQQLAQRFRAHYLQRQDALVLFDGTLGMLQMLKARGQRLAIATGKTRRGLDEALRHAALHDLFDASRTADETAPKPDPRMLHELLAQFGMTPERALMIGDTTHDLAMAEQAGVARVAVGFGAHDPAGGVHDDDAGFAPYAPLHIAHSTADLHAWLERHG